MGGIFVLMTFVSVLLVERKGRRTLHLWGLAGMWIMCILLFLSLLLEDHGQRWSRYVAIIFVILFVIAFAVGPGNQFFIFSILFHSIPFQYLLWKIKSEKIFKNFQLFFSIFLFFFFIKKISRSIFIQMQRVSCGWGEGLKAGLEERSAHVPPRPPKKRKEDGYE